MKELTITITVEVNEAILAHYSYTPETFGQDIVEQLRDRTRQFLGNAGRVTSVEQD